MRCGIHCMSTLNDNMEGLDNIKEKNLPDTKIILNSLFLARKLCLVFIINGINRLKQICEMLHTIAVADERATKFPVLNAKKVGGI